ncbi:alpha/beta fold hydrolase [Massilia pseudoviolaceinigra]|uniref:alpha/beta fold hydrolase n=1 Tax=Massilia pseudoviolaceinigra TaxID=3057165 RepID=UPI002796825F|nr:alpha/beta hydrolase [Massilia sp. CCM 9206]MDQ1923341.1 alpha/beta hydrolase [Massilia sp. CCM 9206]
MRIRDIDLNVRLAGSGTPFLWAHGMMSSMEAEDALDILQWRHFPDSLRLVRYDARGHGGHGGSAASAPATWQQLGQDMLGLADALGENTFIAGGWSMGCASALHAALHAPARVDGLVLALPPTLWEARGAQAALYRRAIALARSMGAARFARLIASDAGGALPSWLLNAAPHLVAAARRGMRDLDAPAMLALFDSAAWSDLPPRAALEALAGTPALIVGWAEDPTHPLASAHELHRLLPRSSLFIAQNHQDLLALPTRLRAFVQATAARR